MSTNDARRQNGFHAPELRPPEWDGETERLEAGRCRETGGALVLLEDSLDSELVKFECEDDGCDWQHVMAPDILEQYLDGQPIPPEEPA